MFSKLRSRDDSSQIPRREAPYAGAACLWRFGQTVCGSKSEAVLVGCLAASLMIGCQGVDVASHREFEYSSRQHTSPGTEIAVINQRQSNHVAHKPLSLREELKKDVTEFWPMVGRDAKQLATVRNAALLGVALGGSLVSREELTRTFVRTPRGIRSVGGMLPGFWDTLETQRLKFQFCWQFTPAVW